MREHVRVFIRVLACGCVCVYIYACACLCVCVSVHESVMRMCICECVSVRARAFMPVRERGCACVPTTGVLVSACEDDHRKEAVHTSPLKTSRPPSDHILFDQPRRLSRKESA